MTPKLARHESNQIKCSIKYLKKGCKNMLVTTGMGWCAVTCWSLNLRKKESTNYERQVYPSTGQS